MQFFRLLPKISPNLGYIFTPRPSYFKVLDLLLRLDVTSPEWSVDIMCPSVVILVWDDIMIATFCQDAGAVKRVGKSRVVGV
jgi:hypothetical protein